MIQKPLKPTASDEARQVEVLLWKIPQHAALGIVTRWLYRIKPKPAPPSLLKPKP